MLNIYVHIYMFVHVYLPAFQGYLKALGMKRTAEVQRDAKIGEAEARKDSGIKVKTLILSDHDNRGA